MTNTQAWIVVLLSCALLISRVQLRLVRGDLKFCNDWIAKKVRESND